jgi:hypothetical protein
VILVVEARGEEPALAVERHRPIRGFADQGLGAAQAAILDGILQNVAHCTTARRGCGIGCFVRPGT